MFGDPYENLRRVVSSPVESMKAYELFAPMATHYRRATCAEVECEAYQAGWKSIFDVTDPEKARAARIIRDRSGRSFTIQEIRGEQGTVERVVFTFAPGQECFAAHRVPLERDPVMIERDGDCRGNPTGRVRRFDRPEDWVEDFAAHQQRLADLAARG